MEEAEARVHEVRRDLAELRRAVEALERDHSDELKVWEAVRCQLWGVLVEVIPGGTREQREVGSADRPKFHSEIGRGSDLDES